MVDKSLISYSELCIVLINYLITLCLHKVVKHKVEIHTIEIHMYTFESSVVEYLLILSSIGVVLNFAYLAILLRKLK